jgi:uncharacterized protein (DUF1501 family)
MKIKKSNNRQISRRSFLSATAAAGTTLMLTPKLMANTTPNSKKNFVLVFLRGGHDALSAVAPRVGSVNLNAKRPQIGYSFPNNANDNFFGINSELTDLISLYREGDLAVIHGTGGTNETTSHFAQMDYVESGSSKKILAEGFLARLAKRLNSDAYALETVMPRSLRSTEQFVLQFTDKNNLLAIQKRPQQDLKVSRTEFLSGFFTGATFGIIRDKATSLNEKQDIVNRKLANSASLSTGYNSKEIGLLSEMLSKGNSGIYSISHTGWDHHRGLKDVFVNKTNNLFKDLKKLKSDLQANGKWNDTTIVVLSEFGRRIGQNGSLGCDHGRGGAAYVLGGKVQGRKIYRKSGYDASLAAAINKVESAPRECIPVATDVRLIFAEVFSKQYGITGAPGLNQIFSYDAATETINDPVRNVATDRLNFIV